MHDGSVRPKRNRIIGPSAKSRYFRRQYAGMSLPCLVSEQGVVWADLESVYRAFSSSSVAQECRTLCSWTIFLSFDGFAGGLSLHARDSLSKRFVATLLEITRASSDP